jgi:FlaA1/EpsC-like NDP-sugar epimerase
MFEEASEIGTTGPEMRRFFFTVNDAVELVVNAIDEIDTIQGKVLSRYMKSALIEDLLDTWIRHKGGKWKKIEGRPGERDDEFLIGEIELPYTREFDLNGVRHYLISFNEKQASPLSVGLSSANTERLSEAEMIELIDSPRE